jgi:hypothetical protein
MNSLVLIRRSVPFTSTLAVASGVALDHKVVIRLVRKYRDDFLEFGPLNFENSVVKRPQGGGEPTEFALLNEDQATYRRADSK